MRNGCHNKKAIPSQCLYSIIVVIYLNLLSSSPDGERTLYITPSSSILCHTGPCLTLSQFAQNSSNWLSSNTTLIFLAGNHTLNIEIFISNISNFSMLKDSTSGEGTHDVVVICQDQAHFIFDCANELWITGLKFIGCGSNRFSLIKNFIIENSTFQGQSDSGTALNINDTNLTIVNSSFASNRVGACMEIFDVDFESDISVRIAGAILVTTSNINIIRCNFLENSAEIGGAIYVHKLSNINIINSTFVNNQATINNTHIQDCRTKFNNSIGKAACTGGAIITLKSSLNIDSCIFINNTNLCGGGGALSVQYKSVAKIRKSEFHGNRANGSGGALAIIILSNVTIESSRFLTNSAHFGGVMQIAVESEIAERNCIYENNLAEKAGGVVSLDQSSLFYDHHGQFFNNSALAAGGVFYAVRSKLTLSHSFISYNQAMGGGGVMYLRQCQQGVTFYESSSLTHNYGGDGGAVYAVESTLYVSSGQQLTMKFNRASRSGGGMYIYRSSLRSGYASITNISYNKANLNGGGICATNSLIVCTQSYLKRRTWPFQTLMLFANNSANKLGGGLYLESASQLRLQKVGDDVSLRKDEVNTSIYFISNSAQDGSAIYVDDETYFETCGGSYSVIYNIVTTNTECFFQVFSEATALNKKLSTASIQFITTDNSFSTIIFGGLLDRCAPDPGAEIYTDGYGQNSKEIDGMTYLKLISNINDTDYISSLPVRVCFCTPSSQPDCSYEPPIVHVKKGESFNVSLVAVDQVNHTLKNIIVHSSLSHTKSSLGEEQTTQGTGNACTNLTFSIYSPYASEKLVLYAEGPCRNARKSLSRVHVIFQPCTCPIGFQPKYQSNDCVCICDSRLNPYFTETDNNCNFETESIARHGNFWISFISDSTSDKDNIGNSSGFLIYPYCPLDYCLPPNSDVYINLNIINGTDAQCANNRSGLLCSQCQPDLSLSLGSSCCISCSKMRYKWFVLIMVVSILAGILLVVLLMTLNLTVAIGTLNGLIFLANIIGANSSTFFSGLSNLTRFHSSLISWLNLEVGFDVCFFEGMDIYWKTWLQLAFPAYVIFLVILVIFVSEYSMRFSRLIARRNPVATLATLILLSYTKFLQTMITALSLAILDYPDGSHKRVWLPDATVEYLSGKHIPLFIAAVFILIIGTAYTCIIFLWQWLLYYQNKTIFRWVRSQRLCHFIEPYHAPYISKHRYWTGLLLFTRIVLYLVFSLNVSGDPGVNLLAITITVVCLLILKGQFGRVYKVTFIDVIEMISYANLFVFSAVRLKFGTDKVVNITADVSGIITLVLLTVIISYNTYTIFCLKYMKRCRYQSERQLDDNALTNDNAINTISTERYDCSEPTFSVVELKLPGSGREHPEACEREVSRNTNNDNNPTDVTSPLLN